METTLTRPVEVVARADSDPGLTPEEFERLVSSHQRRVYRVLLAIVRDGDLADTLTQECFLRAYRKRASFRGTASVATWLVRIAVNLARDHAKNRRLAFWRRLFSRGQAQDPPAAMQEIADPRSSPEQALLAREEAAAMWSVVDSLSPQQRAVFFLRFAEEMNLEEIAQAMDLEVGTVKSHLFRAVGAVRKNLKR